MSQAARACKSHVIAKTTSVQRRRALICLYQLSMKKLHRTKRFQKRTDLRQSVLVRNSMKSMSQAVTTVYRGMLEKKRQKLQDEHRCSADSTCHEGGDGHPIKLDAMSEYVEVMDSLVASNDGPRRRNLSSLNDVFESAL